MKIYAAVLAVVVSANKKVGENGKTPLQRLEQLERHSCKWLTMWTPEKFATRWCKKFGNNSNKMAMRFEKCGWYEGMEDDDSRKRRDAVERGIDTQERINYENPEQGIRQITTGYRKWAERYINECPKQPATQVARSKRWLGIISKKIMASPYEGSG